MADYSISQTQKTSQLQVQKMSQKQIFALKLISMNNMELRDEIYKFAEENPAFEITDDSYADGIKNVKNTGKNLRLTSVHSGKSGKDGEELSDNFQKMLESSPDSRESLQEHLLSQLRMSHINKEEFSLCEKLINNLDENGWHFLSPSSLLDKNNPRHTEEFLNHCISIIQKFDPVGICCKNVTESLEIQAKEKADADKLSLFILHGHLELISPPIIEKVEKKLNQIIKDQEKMAFLKPEDILEKDLITEENINRSINFIKNLNPFPARDYDSSFQAQFVSPDVTIVKKSGNLEKDDFEAGLVKAGRNESEVDNSTSKMDSDNFFFRIIPEKDTLPGFSLSPSFDEDFKGLKKSARDFIETLDFRNRAVLRIFSILVSLQKDFFLYGPEKLKPLTQKKLSELSDVHESTISRFADSKFLRCEWGTFPVKYFFTSAIGKKVETLDDSTESTVSSNTVKIEIQKILEEHKNDKKKLSDQKLADLLNEKGIKIARRTVAKYRSQLNIESSYTR